MEKQQTAVDKFYQAIKMHLTPNQIMHLEIIYPKAKEMEKKQKVESYKNGYANGQTDAFSN